ncbi:MAG: 2,3-bisphosphoglycerate-independent phosphoglycerate mutase [candidate division NC10 bacterium]|nr:2,3-bisphosphoglycerate-independent phosphoglycerate mutase [candidate division NC10 bacterium]MBI2163269.1 2,3-bisphosphoglycerate-independent phosphoglycerate mutase [candidate division NC10 bacterium]MBI2458028.1 2,3-bisphosphoglycerate-independent phosphoglycerate mutase [candidate division NC10 bacterium]MBI2562576.1 2,3-bisphosphoglycerate-independent phosphoglycerate mutase [candidate division NC10 bacterium]MBI3121094.1 2,3-bisphosphoglycerate-independent phosphoglycerate mutase [can
MVSLDDLKALSRPAQTKIVLLVLDGLGGLSRAGDGKTELDAARTPNLDRLAAQGNLGLADPVAPGITPGSGPGHLGLFGYDPLRYRIGRGVLEAVGIDLTMTERDLAARGNFCTVDAKGLITDRRAGRIPTERCASLTPLLEKIGIPGVELIVRPVREHRFVVLFRGDGVEEGLSETDPQETGKPPLPVQAEAPQARKAADIANRFVAEARRVLAAEHPANMILLRGFSKYPRLPKLTEIYGVRAAVIAVYPMYRGLAKLAGMQAVKTGDTVAEEFATLESVFGDFDFFFLHVKKTDSAGEDGNFDKKVSIIEEVDAEIPRLLALTPDVLVVTGDHSTPATFKAHSWHPVPVLLWSKWCRPDGAARFTERECRYGNIGHIRAAELMPLVMAHAERLTKFGA